MDDTLTARRAATPQVTARQAQASRDAHMLAAHVIESVGDERDIVWARLCDTVGVPAASLILHAELDAANLDAARFTAEHPLPGYFPRLPSIADFVASQHTCRCGKNAAA